MSENQDIAVAERMETWPIDKLKPYKHNPVNHSEKQKEALRDLLKEVGFRIPILAREEDGQIADGHLRLEIAEEEGIDELPVIPVDDLTDEQIKVLRIGVQKTAYDGEFNQDLLQRELSELEEAGINTGLTGFDDYELDLMDVDENFSFGGEVSSDDEEGEPITPDDEADVTGERVENYVIHLSFSEKDEADAFLEKVGADREMKGKTTMLDGDSELGGFLNGD